MRRGNFGHEYFLNHLKFVLQKIMSLSFVSCAQLIFFRRPRSKNFWLPHFGVYGTAGNINTCINYTCFYQNIFTLVIIV